VRGYRARAPSCPECGEALAPQLVAGTVVDLCDGCGGMWADWFDGELPVLARARPPWVRRGVRRLGHAACPRCCVELVSDAVAGADVLRCEECQGTFVPFLALGPVSQTGRGHRAPWWQRLYDRLMDALDD
jgi:Zn-finger nucleic acid-binding protein